MLYTTIDPKRHWYFNTSLVYFLKNDEVKFSNVFEILKLLYLENKTVILLDSGLYDKLFLLVFSNKNLFVVLHGELGYVNHSSFKYRLYYKILCFCIKISSSNKILLSRYISLPFISSNKYILEHPGFSRDFDKIHFANNLVSFGAISNSKISNSSLHYVDNLLVKNNYKVDHFGSSLVDLNFKKIFFNGFISDNLLNKLFAENKFILLLNDSNYHNVVSGIVIQAIYNRCFIITLERYPEIIDFYESLYNINFHIDLCSFLLIQDKNVFYETQEMGLIKLKNILINNTNSDIVELLK